MLLGSATEATDGFTRLPVDQAIKQLMPSLVDKIKQRYITLVTLVAEMQARPTAEACRKVLAACEDLDLAEGSMRRLAWTAGNALESRERGERQSAA